MKVSDIEITKLSSAEIDAWVQVHDKVPTCKRCGAQHEVEITTNSGEVTVGSYCPNNHGFRFLYTSGSLSAALG